jgi:hypothetical protein
MVLGSRHLLLKTTTMLTLMLAQMLTLMLALMLAQMLTLMVPLSQLPQRQKLD